MGFGEENVRRIIIAAAIGLFASAASAEDLKIALIYGKTGPLEAYAKQTETGLRMGFEYATKGTMAVDGRKIVIIAKDDQTKPDVAKTALAEAYEDDGVALAIGTSSSAAALAMLPVAEERKRGSRRTRADRERHAIDLIGFGARGLRGVERGPRGLCAA